MLFLNAHLCVILLLCVFCIINKVNGDPQNNEPQKCSFVLEDEIAIEYLREKGYMVFDYKNFISINDFKIDEIKIPPKMLSYVLLFAICIQLIKLILT